MKDIYTVMEFLHERLIYMVMEFLHESIKKYLHANVMA